MMYNIVQSPYFVTKTAPCTVSYIHMHLYVATKLFKKKRVWLSEFFAIYATLNERRFNIQSYLLSCGSIEALHVDAILYICI